MDLEKLIEATLFFKSEPVKTDWLSEMLGKKRGEIEEALQKLEENLKGRGIRLITTNDTVTLGTVPEAGPDIERIAKLELERDLGKAALETLTIILYRGPLTRSQIDYIRGVNSSFILRTLLIRGLVEREKNPQDERGFIYKPTIELLSYLGIGNPSELPEYEKLREEVAKFEESFAQKEAETNEHAK